ncbi:MAG: DUF4259 domain-containing protein [Steroidobacteraceae bacterium]
MGAWGIGIFDNDGAADWASGLEGQSDTTYVEDALDRIVAAGEQYVDASDAEEALAAAETVARLKGTGGARSAYSEAVDHYVARARIKPAPALIAKAVEVVDRILREPSELLELWNEGDEGASWQAELAGLRERLTAG